MDDKMISDNSLMLLAAMAEREGITAEELLVKMIKDHEDGRFLMSAVGAVQLDSETAGYIRQIASREKVDATEYARRAIAHRAESDARRMTQIARGNDEIMANFPEDAWQKIEEIAENYGATAIEIVPNLIEIGYNVIRDAFEDNTMPDRVQYQKSEIIGMLAP